MPRQIVSRSNEILTHLEKDKINDHATEKLQKMPKEEFQLSLFEADPKFMRVKELIDKLDVNATSPIEALLKLNEIKDILK